ncbi:MAG: mutT [Herbinix sp.]|jgi:8-oxo-dGTP diphosphatase|nr:mutT [Herbinix sp.]
MKKIEVVAAILVESGKILATQRGYGEFKDGWEFPGGKVEVGELKEDALHREIWEELNIKINMNQLLTTVEYDYPSFHLTMHCFLCTINSGELKLIEHKAAKWLAVEELDRVNWLPADLDVIRLLQEVLR